MRVAIVGIGGVGGFIGSKLAATYFKNPNHTISFIQRGEHGKTIREQGLTFIGKTVENVHPDECFSSFKNTGFFDVIILCTKNKDLENTVKSFAQNLHSKSVVITLLNGIQNAERIQNILPNHRVIQGCIYVSAAITKPGTVSQKGNAEHIFIGPENSAIKDIDKKITNLLTDAGLTVTLSKSITLDVWRKYLFISAFATVTSRYNKSIGEVVRDEALLSVTKSLFNEIILLAKKLNVELTQEDADNAIDLAFKIPVETTSSMQLDVYSGKLPELDIFTGYVVFEAKRQKLRLPFHETIYKNLVLIIQKQINE